MQQVSPLPDRQRQLHDAFGHRMERTQWAPAPEHGRRALKCHEAAAQQRVLQLEQARQNHQISPDAYNHELHLSSFSYLANVMALRRLKMQAQQTQFRRSMY